MTPKSLLNVRGEIIPCRLHHMSEDWLRILTHTAAALISINGVSVDVATNAGMFPAFLTPSQWWYGEIEAEKHKWLIIITNS